MISDRDSGCYNFKFAADDPPYPLSSVEYSNFEKAFPLKNNSFQKYYKQSDSGGPVIVQEEYVDFKQSKVINPPITNVKELYRILYPYQLCKELNQNLFDHKIRVLQLLQKYMVTLFLLDKPFVLTAPKDSGKKLGYLIPLVEKLASSKNGRPYRKWNGPTAIIACYSDKKAKLISDLFSKFSRGTCLKHVVLSSDHDLCITGADLYIGKIQLICDFVKMNDIELDSVDYLILEDCDKAGVPEFAKQLKKLHSCFIDAGGIPYLTYLIHGKMMSSAPILQGFTSKQHSKLKFVKESFDCSLKAFLFTFIEPSKEQLYGKKFKALSKELKSLLDSMKEEFNKSEHRCLIFVNSAKMAYYLSAFLSKILGIHSFPITSSSGWVEVENATLRLRDNVPCLLVADYASIRKVPESGYIGYVFCFDLPSNNVYRTLINMRLLLRNVKGHICILYSPKFDLDATIDLYKFFNRLKMPMPQSLVDLYDSLRRLK